MTIICRAHHSCSSARRRACSHCAPLTGGEQFELAGPTFAGEEVYATCIDTRSGTPPAVRRLGEQPLGPGAAPLGRPRRDVDRARAGGAARSPTTPTPRWPGSGSWRRARPTSPTSCTPAWNRRRCSAATTAAARFSLVRGLWDHPHRPQWEPGGGGLCLHTVLVHPDDPQRLLIAISAAGVYRSDDGGESWRASNRGIVVGVPARGRRPRVRPVRAQGGPRRRRPRAALPAAPRRHLPQRRRRWVVGRR